MNPVFAMILAIPLLGEKVGSVRWLAAATALTGALILLRPTPDSFQPAALLALAAAFVTGIEMIFIKKLTGLERVLQILIINNLIGVAIASVAVFSYAVLVFAALYDFAIFDLVPDWISVVGAGVIISGALLLAIREGRVRP